MRPADSSEAIGSPSETRSLLLDGALIALWRCVALTTETNPEPLDNARHRERGMDVQALTDISDDLVSGLSRWIRRSGAVSNEGRIDYCRAVIAVERKMANVPAGVADDVFVRLCLWNVVPESRGHITTLEDEELAIFGEDGEGGPGMYSLVSECFVHPILIPALRSTSVDAALVTRCASFVDELLGSGRPLVVELVSIRITDQLLGYRELWEIIKRFAGPLLLKEVAERKKYYYGFD